MSLGILSMLSMPKLMKFTNVSPAIHAFNLGEFAKKPGRLLNHEVPLSLLVENLAITL